MLILLLMLKLILFFVYKKINKKRNLTFLIFCPSDLEFDIARSFIGFLARCYPSEISRMAFHFVHPLELPSKTADFITQASNNIKLFSSSLRLSAFP